MEGMMMHCGAGYVTREEVAVCAVPEPTQTWTPIPHHTLIDLTANALENSGYRIVADKHALNKGGAHYFGTFELRNGVNHDDRALMVGLRNSHDKTYPASLVVGNKVFVCDNLSFSGEVKISRKHTARIMEDLPRLVVTAMARLADVRHIQDRRFEAYKSYDLLDREMHDLLVQALDCKALNTTALPRVLQSWRDPEHPEFKDRNLWSAFNAFTQNYKDLRLNEVSQRSQRLHGLFDGRAGLHFEREIELAAEEVAILN